MLLLLLRDGSYVEVTNAEDVIHRPGVLVCVDESAEPLLTFAADEVVAYTARPDIAQRMIAGDTNGSKRHRGGQAQSARRPRRTTRPRGRSLS
jgi:hypothetical protein